VSLATGTGSGSSAEGDVLEEIENLTGSAFDDTLIGNDLVNVLTGGAGADMINGGGGDDLLVGGAGNDDIIGGDGIDTLSYEAAAAAVQIDLHFTGYRQNGGDGLDQLYGDIENLIGSEFDDSLTGTIDANVIYGGAGNDEIWGSGGGDRLIGGAGDDFLSGGAYGTDTYVFGPAFGNDLIFGFKPKAMLPPDLHLPHDVFEIDPSVFPDFAAVMAAATEDDFGNTIIRLDDSNSIALWGVPKAKLSADDFLFVRPGMDGNDTVLSTSGNDTLNGGSGIDTASYTDATAGVTASLARTGPQNTIGAGTDTLISIENLTGSAFADILTGNDGGNVLSGGAGNDRLTGGLGRDTLTGGAGNDVLDFNALAESGVGAGIRDVIIDFQRGFDDIDVSGIDAKASRTGDQNFSFIGTREFSGKAGELHFQTFDEVGTANDITVVSGDVDGDRSADFEIEIFGIHQLTNSDFLL
jgi:Ca2+-binding RTX toxin-like protein